MNRDVCHTVFTFLIRKQLTFCAKCFYVKLLNNTLTELYTKAITNPCSFLLTEQLIGSLPQGHILLHFIVGWTRNKVQNWRKLKVLSNFEGTSRQPRKLNLFNIILSKVDLVKFSLKYT
jgi:hypothetical protein